MVCICCTADHDDGLCIVFLGIIVHSQSPWILAGVEERTYVHLEAAAAAAVHSTSVNANSSLSAPSANTL